MDEEEGVQGEEEIFEMSVSGSCAEDDKFDYYVGLIQDLVMSEEFQELQESFFDQNCEHFEDTEENKLIYMTIFTSYVETIERYIETQLSDINFQEFSEMI